MCFPIDGIVDSGNLTQGQGSSEIRENPEESLFLGWPLGPLTAEMFSLIFEY